MRLDLHGDGLKLSNGSGSGLVGNYKINQEAGGHTIVVFNLKDSVSITAQKALPPSGQYGHRIFFDLIEE